MCTAMIIELARFLIQTDLLYMRTKNGLCAIQRDQKPIRSLRLDKLFITIHFSYDERLSI